MLDDTLELRPDLPILDTAGTLHSFATVKQDATGSVRIDESTTLLAPRYLTLRSTASKPKPSAYVLDRHLIQVNETKLNASDDPEVAGVNLTLNLPRTTTFSLSDLQDLLGYAVNFAIYQQRLEAVLRGEH